MPPRRFRMVRLRRYNAFAWYPAQWTRVNAIALERRCAIPKLVDREERRANIAEAILRIAVSRGLDQVSLRDVAAEAGVSMGQVQHYFSTKREMLLFACHYIVQRTRGAIEATIMATDGEPSARAALRATMVRLLPTDEASRSAAWVLVAFLARGVVDPVIEKAMRDTWISSHAYMAARLRAARESGELPPDRDPDHEAVILLSFIDGLTSHVLVGHYSPDRACAAIDAFLDRLLTGAGGSAGRTRLRAGSDTD